MSVVGGLDTSTESRSPSTTSTSTAGSCGGGRSRRRTGPTWRPGCVSASTPPATTDRADACHLRELLAAGRLPQCWIPPAHVLECRALLETYHALRVEHTAWVQRVHAVLFHQGAPGLGAGTLSTAGGQGAGRLWAGHARCCGRPAWHPAPQAR